MSRVRSKDTRPEMVVRRMAHGLGYRYRLHDRRLPGSPDLVFAGRKKVIWVLGCFWHGHDCKNGIRVPKSNVEFWTTKKLANAARDQRNRAALEAMGWAALVLWECELSMGPTSLVPLKSRLVAFLGARGPG